jgi:hypothetical protein
MYEHNGHRIDRTEVITIYVYMYTHVFILTYIYIYEYLNNHVCKHIKYTGHCIDGTEVTAM